jgi:hypothetical protein
MLLIVFVRELQRGGLLLVFRHRNLLKVSGKSIYGLDNIRFVMLGYAIFLQTTAKKEFSLPLK